MAFDQGIVGPAGTALADGVTANLRQGRQTDLMVSELHGRFYEQVFRGNVYSIGCQLTALSAATATLTASGQPIVGVANPISSGVNLVILQAMLRAALNNVTSVAPGDFFWASSVGNSSVFSAGLAPFNRKTLTSAGSQAKAFSLSTASLLTGLVTTPVVAFDSMDANTASALLTTTVAAATPTPSVFGVHNFDGSLIVPPGGVLGLFNSISSTTHSVAARLMWEEVPI
jgi:hypothetical protein